MLDRTVCLEPPDLRDMIAAPVGVTYSEIAFADTFDDAEMWERLFPNGGCFFRAKTGGVLGLRVAPYGGNLPDFTEFTEFLADDRALDLFASLHSVVLDDFAAVLERLHDAVTGLGCQSATMLRIVGAMFRDDGLLLLIPGRLEFLFGLTQRQLGRRLFELGYASRKLGKTECPKWLQSLNFAKVSCYSGDVDAPRPSTWRCLTPHAARPWPKGVSTESLASVTQATPLTPVTPPHSPNAGLARHRDRASAARLATSPLTGDDIERLVSLLRGMRSGDVDMDEEFADMIHLVSRLMNEVQMHRWALDQAPVPMPFEDVLEHLHQRTVDIAPVGRKAVQLLGHILCRLHDELSGMDVEARQSYLKGCRWPAWAIEILWLMRDGRGYRVTREVLDLAMPHEDTIRKRLAPRVDAYRQAFLWRFEGETLLEDLRTRLEEIRFLSVSPGRSCAVVVGVMRRWPIEPVFAGDWRGSWNNLRRRMGSAPSG
jgi:hypothetical protein